jgi:hypothetical protein
MPDGTVVFEDLTLGEIKIIPIKEGVMAACEMLGIDPLEVGNEGKIVIATVPEKAEDIVAALKKTKEGKNAEIIGEATDDFKEVHATQWKANYTVSGQANSIVESFRSEARWEKAFQHLRELGQLELIPRDIPKLFAELERDFLEEEEAKKRLFNFGIIYSGQIRGEEWINIGPYTIPSALELLGKPVKAYEIDLGGFGKADVKIYRNPYSESSEYWLYCPQIFSILYPGENNHDWRGVQTMLYRKACLKFLSEKFRDKEISDKYRYTSYILDE